MRNQNVRSFGCAILMIAAVGAATAAPELLSDPLDGTGARTGAWRQAPQTIVDVPNGGRALRCTRGTTWNAAGLAWVGDRSWSAYRVEVEIQLEQMWAEIDFHVREDGQAGCAFTLIRDQDGTLFLELFGLWGEAGAFKMYLPGQRHPPHRTDQWTRVRLDVGPAVANVFVDDDPQPVATFFDLPFAHGGVRLTAYAGSALFRNLRITALAPGVVQPILADPWAGVRGQGVLRDWQVSPAFAPGTASDQLPEAISRGAGAWVPAPVDGRGVVNLAAHFQPNNVAATAFARTTVRAERNEELHLKLTYTDNFSLWCNGARVFVGPPRQWFHPDREKYGNSRLIPDQFEVTVPLRAGENELIVRSEAVEPFGWGFWIRECGRSPVATALVPASGMPVVSAEAVARRAPCEEHAVVMTYVANEGFLISGAGHKVLIDAVFTEGWGRFPIPPAEVLAQMRDAAPPYDRVTALLLTHRDGDHVDPASVIAHLRNDSACVLIGPAQVNELLQAQPGYDVVKARIFAVPRTPAVFERMVQGLRFKTVLLDHDGDSPTEPASSHNVGHLFTVGGIKFLHAGDTGESDPEAWRRLGLAKEKIDVLILPWFFLTELPAVPTRRIIDDLKPKVIVLVHFPTRASAASLVPADRTKDLPPVFSMEKPMTALAFDRKGTDLMVTRIDGAPGNER